MKKKMDLYEMSKSMTGRERFILEFEGMKETEIKDEDCIPKICTDFYERKDLMEYRAMNLDLMLANLSLARIAMGLYSLILFLISLRREIDNLGGEEDKSLTLLPILGKMQEFLGLYETIEAINALHDFDLLLPSIREPLDEAKEEILRMKEILTKANKISIEVDKDSRIDKRSEIMRDALYKIAGLKFDYEI